MHSIEQSDAQEIIDNLGENNFQFAGKTILLVGIAGFLGKCLTNYLLRLNETILANNPVKVVGSDTYLIGNTPLIYTDKNFTALNHDICLPFDTKLGPNDKIDYIWNMASVASPIFYKKMPLVTLDIGYAGTKNILNLAYQKQAKSVVLMSSSEVYGDPDEANVPTKEEYNGNVSSVGERACYDQSKKVLETLGDIFYRLYNVPIKTIRPFNCFGAGMNIKDGRVLPSFISKALNSELLPVYGLGQETRTFVYVTDFLTGLIKLSLSEYNGQIFNLGADNTGEISMVDLANLVCKIVGNPKVKVEFLEPISVYKKQPKRRAPDLSKVREAIGYSPKVSLEEGVRRYFEWAKTLNS